MLEVIYEDNHLLVVNKPHGILTQPSGTTQKNLEDMAKLWVKEKCHKEGNIFLEAVHRLDKAASGIVVFARTSKALSRLMTAVKNRQVRKCYRVWIEGTPPSKKGTLENYLLHGDYKARVVTKETPKAKLARLHYQVIKKEKNQSLLEIDLETGRYHQIRVQFAHIGCPLVGDLKYGSHLKREKEGIALHHCRIEIPHPISKKIMVFEHG